MTALELMGRRRFAPLFWTQFLGAFNDNLFKTALAVLVTYRALSVGGLDAAFIVPLSAGLFILPFFLFSAWAGQISDKLSKTSVLRWTKLWEVGVMILAVVAFYLQSLPLLLLVLFLMGTQSTFFGPAKYSILPELLDTDDLVGGNALVETGTFLAVLLGQIGGTVLVAYEVGDTWVGVSCVALAILGTVASYAIVPTAPAAPRMKVSADPVRPLLETFRVTHENRPVYLSIIGISWFWFLGASFITVLPVYAKEVLFGTEAVFNLFLVIFSVGVAVGAMITERLSFGRLELGLVPLGSIGMTLFALDLFFAGSPHRSTAPADPTQLRDIWEFLQAPGSIRIAVDFAGLAVFSGFYTVPLYTMIQQRTEASVRSRVIAWNNILNALFMVASAVFLLLFAVRGLSLPQIFLVIALMNAAVAMYIYTVIPEFLLRFLVWMLACVMYRVRVRGLENVPREGPAVLVCNHVSFVDWLIIAAAVKRPARFVMYHRFAEIPVMGFFVRDAKVIPIAPAHEDEGVLERALDRIAQELEAGELVCIFPEGRITKTGEMNVFRTGIERIIARTPVPVIPMALTGLLGSLFSRQRSSWLARDRSPWTRVGLTVGPPVAPEAVSADDLGRRVAALGGLAPPPLEEVT
jgi:1-acyl-sn-glycerol-3-phosphate acyltransferase